MTYILEMDTQLSMRREFMRKALFLIFAMAICIGQRSVSAQVTTAQKQLNAALPEIITDGFIAYKEKGPEEAVKVWIRGSPIDGSKDALTQANNLRQVQDYYGAYTSHDVIAIEEPTARTHLIYMIMNYEKGPLFAKFTIFKTDLGWVLINFNFNTKDEAVFPAGLIK
jgi:hypothetical protein